MCSCVIVWIFVTLTTLYGDPEAYTYTTSWMESSPCVSLWYMFKEWTLWNFLCIISWHMFTCIVRVLAGQVLRDLVRLFGTWPLSFMLWVFCSCQKERLQSLKGSEACSQLRWNSVLGLHNARLLRRFTRVMQTNVVCEQGKHQTTSGRRKWERNSFRRPLESGKCSMLTRKSPRNFHVGLVSNTWNFALLTLLCRACNVKAMMTSWTRNNPRVNIGYILEFPMCFWLAYVHVYYQWEMLFGRCTIPRDLVRLVWK